MVWNFTLEDLRTPGVYSGVSILAGNVVTGNSPSANYGTSGSIICSYTSRFPSSFELTISCSCSIVGMYLRSTSFGSVSALANIGSISVSGSIRSMYWDSVYPPSTPVVLISTMGRILRPRKSRSLVCPWPSAFTRAIMVSGIGSEYQLCLLPFSWILGS